MKTFSNVDIKINRPGEIVLLYCEYNNASHLHGT